MQMSNLNLTEPEFGMVNELVPGALPIGAYCMGIATIEAARAGFPLTWFLLKTARECTSIEEGVLFARQWVADSKKKLKGRKASQ